MCLHFVQQLLGISRSCSAPVHTNGGFTLTHQMFSVHTKPEEFENATITGHFGFVVKEKNGHGNQMIVLRSSFSESSKFSKCLSSTLKRKAGVFKFLCRFEELRFRDGLVWTVGLTVEIKLRFHILRHCVDRASHWMVLIAILSL